MKRYIRLKSGKIIESKDYGTKVSAWNRVVAESDDIIDLIQVGDLIKYSVALAEVGDVLLDCLLQGIITVSKLYTKQGDNYILVWDKERGII